jgi:D-alanyl-lipoteichoic acid acyltransferase DltB (MBOAT superfamily)
MEKYEPYKKMLLIVSNIMVVFPLLIIKEVPFFYDAVLHKENPVWLIIPIGISFYTLQLISYNVDLYRGDIVPEKNYFKFLLFVSFFPQIIQGPIPRYSQLAQQFYGENKFDDRKIVKGFMMIIWGFFLKLCIADKAGTVVNTIFDEFPTYEGLYLVVAAVLYGVQLYADFMSCTSLAQGISNLFGIELRDNFQRPFFATSIKDFWRRWHISLSSWLKDYIYIPLGGNRKGAFRKYLNILITFAVSGIWHGGGFKFLFWGLMHGLYQIFGELLNPVKKGLKNALHIKDDSQVLRLIQSVWTFFLVMLAWIIFRADNLKTGLSMIKSMFTVPNVWIFTDDSLFSLGLVWKEVIVLLVCLGVLLAVGIIKEKGIAIRDNILKLNIAVRWGIYLALIVFIVIFGTYGFGFDAQSFIYGRF